MKKVLSIVAALLLCVGTQAQMYHPEVQSSRLKSKRVTHNGSCVQA